MRIQRRYVHSLAWVAGGAIAAAALFLTAQIVQVPSYSADTTPHPAQASFVDMPSRPFMPLSYPESPSSGETSPPAMDPPPLVQLPPEAPLPMQFPVGTDSAPAASPAAIGTDDFDPPWAIGRLALNDSSWLPPTGPSGPGYALAYPITPAGPVNQKSYGGDPNGPDTGHIYQYEGTDEPSTIPVPEPASIGLLTLGLALLSIRRTRP